MIKKINSIILLLTVLLISGNAKETIRLKPSENDQTLEVRRVLEAVKDKEVEVILEKGTYHFKPDYAFTEYTYVTNHDNGLKKIIFPFRGFDKVTIIGDGADLIFYGQLMPFQFRDCKAVKVSGITIDWDVPFCIQGEVLATNEKENWVDLKLFTDGYSWKYEKGKLTFPNIDGFAYSKLGSTLAFDAEHKRVAHGAYDVGSDPKRIEKQGENIFRLHDSYRYYPEVGTILNFKGLKGENRYAPAIQTISSKNIHFDKVVIHHALGMGYLFERSEDIRLSNCGVYVRDGSDRVVSATADATHFCNCKGDILIEGCRFENMLDDGTNVHGTYMEVEEVLNENSLMVAFKHFQQTGFEFAGVGDEMWFIQQPNPNRATVNTVKTVDIINEQFIQLTFEDKLPENISKGDLLESKTWNPTFTMRGCTIRDHRARNIVLKTPEKIVIEDNDFSSMMSSVFFRGESYYWFESGAVEDVLIRNNRFDYCAYSGAEHAVMYITPRLGKTFNQNQTFDRNIRFENNTITTFDARIIWADRVDGLHIIGNKITQNQYRAALYPDAPIFDFTNCKNVQIKNNTYNGRSKNYLKTDAASANAIKKEGNSGIQ